MRTLVMGTFALAILMAVGPGLVQAGSNHTSMLSEGPGGLMLNDPPVMQIAQGDSVTWMNMGTQMHEVEFHIDADPVGDISTVVDLTNPLSPADLDHIHLMPGDSFTYTFVDQGVYVINCNLGATHTTGKQVIVVQ